MTGVLEVENLSISFTRRERWLKSRMIKAIRSLTINIAVGEIAAVVGSSGSGKSLLAHAVLGILPDNASVNGMIRYCGLPMTSEMAEKLRGREIALVPQSVSYLDPLMKVSEQICKWPQEQSLSEKLDETLSKYGLCKGTGSLYPFELSGGMARRVLVASAIIGNPKLVIADEPTPGLDRGAAEKVLEHFKEIAQNGSAVLFITHDLELAVDAADKVTVLYAGETVEEAAASDFRNASSLRHPYTRALWNALPQNGFIPLAGSQPRLGEVVCGCAFAPRCPVMHSDCFSIASVPYVKYRGGMVRCLHPYPLAEK